VAAISLLAAVAFADDTSKVADSRVVEDKVITKVDSAKAGAESKKAETEKWVTTKTGLQILDTKIGTGDEAKVGMKVAMHYTGWLWVDSAKKGEPFDSSRKRGQPYPVLLGARSVIAGWEEGILGMKEGGQRTLIIPPALAYGERGFPGAIPPNSTLIFELEFVKEVK
jgi:FKBP-type peptidyl-prolyl cis-trans isomerase